jgi:serine/threonine protein kinase
MSRTGSTSSRSSSASKSDESVFPSEEIPKLNADFVAAGSYGCVVKPALPNVNVEGNDPSWKYYDGNVTKLYTNKDHLKKAIKDAKRIYKMTDNDGHLVHPYKFEAYKGKHLKPATLKACKYIPANKFMNPLRMPNLGYSIHDLKRGRHEELAVMRKIPASVIFKQILKCLKQVERFHAKGYIHGDLRTTNIMVDPSTGAITIIDFDWFSRTDDFFHNYMHNLGYYNNPPECLLPQIFTWIPEGKSIEAYIKEILATEVSSSTPREIRKFVSVFQTYVQQTTSMHEYRLNPKFAINEKALVNSLVKSADFITEKIGSSSNKYKTFYKLVEPSFDSYGLCFSLLELIYLIYPRVFEEKTKESIERFARATSMAMPVADVAFDTLQEFIKDVLVPCTSLTLQDRLPIGGAYEKAKSIFDKFDSEVGTVMGALTRTKSRSRSPASRSRARPPGFGSPRPTKRAKKNQAGGAKRASAAFTRRRA